MGGTAVSGHRTYTRNLLGEVLTDRESGEVQLIPAIRIMTDDGEITIPVENFVKFKKNPDESK